MDVNRAKLRKSSLDYCQYKSLEFLQEEIRQGNITSEQASSVIQLLDFATFIDKIESIQQSLTISPNNLSLGDEIAQDFGIIFLVNDALEVWKEQHLIPITKFVQE